MDIALQRLRNQRLIGQKFQKPDDVVRWLGAVQAQDYYGAKWGIAQRCENVTDRDLDDAFNSGKVLRTHVLRPTWHFVVPEDIRWMLALAAPRVHAASAYYYRKTELDPPFLKQCGELLESALRGNSFLTRSELADRFKGEGIQADGLRFGYILGYWELEQLICSGPLRGKQFTYALIDERVETSKVLDRQEALTELTWRYFSSHGPATVQDFGNWSGLTIADGKAGLEANQRRLLEEVVDGKSYWFSDSSVVERPEKPAIHFLPNYDEHLIAYKDYRPAFDPDVYESLEPNDYRMLAHLMTRDGKVVGGWKRTIARKRVDIQANLVTSLSDVDMASAQDSARHYGEFLGLPVDLTVHDS